MQTNSSSYIVLKYITICYYITLWWRRRGGAQKPPFYILRTSYPFTRGVIWVLWNLAEITMRHGHLTEQRKNFVEAYCRLGNGTLIAREAGYKDSPSLVNQACKLKRELSAEISEELTANFTSAAPKAMWILMVLAENSASDSVKFQASKDLLDPACFRPIDRREEIRPQRSKEQLES